MTGKQPFEGESFEQIFVAMSTRQMVPLSELRPDAPPALVVVIDRCLQPSREHRWPSVAALQATLAEAFPRPASTVIPEAPASLRSPLSLSVSPAPMPLAPAPASSSSVLRIIIGILGGMILGGLGISVGCVALSYYLASGTSTTPLPIKETRHVEPLDLLPIVRSRARAYSSAATLSSITVNSGQNGVVDLDASGTISFSFTTPKAATPTLILLASNAGMTSQPAQIPPGPASSEPRCRYGQAWKAAVAAGLLASATLDADYGLAARNAWSFRGASAAGTKTVEVDGQTCAAGRLH